RLPGGMKNMRYDFEKTYRHHRNDDGSLWEGAEGADSGEPIAGTGTLDEKADFGGRADGYRLFIVDAVRLNLIPLERATPRSPARHTSPIPLCLPSVSCAHRNASFKPPEPTLCPESSKNRRFVRGDMVWDLAQARGLFVDSILHVSRDIRCYLTHRRPIAPKNLPHSLVVISILRPPSPCRSSPAGGRTGN
ncbi:hypothetical protein C8T65DRAFT_574245, partial [Cerioporus squamosus]